MLDVSVVVYLNDILIYLDDQESHQANVREVLCRLHKLGLFCNLFKCEFHTDTIEYLDYILLPSGLRMASDKVDTITQWPTAKSRTFNLSSVSATSIDDLYSTIQKLLFHLHDSLKKTLCGSGHHNANSLLIR